MVDRLKMNQTLLLIIRMRIRFCGGSLGGDLDLAVIVSSRLCFSSAPSEIREEDFDADQYCREEKHTLLLANIVSRKRRPCC
jgi:hypothetical protein